MTIIVGCALGCHARPRHSQQWLPPGFDNYPPRTLPPPAQHPPRAAPSSPEEAHRLADEGAAKIAKAVWWLRHDSALYEDTHFLETLSNLTVTFASQWTNAPAAAKRDRQCVEVDSPPCHGGPYLKVEDLTDPWGHPYVASVDAKTSTIVVRSAGPDGHLGTLDDISRTSSRDGN